MPEAGQPLNWEAIFVTVRKLAGDASKRRVVLVRPDRPILLWPCPPPGSAPAERLAAAERMIPSEAKRNIAVIAPTEHELSTASDPAVVRKEELLAMIKAIPSFGLLAALAYIGHAVWIFDGRAARLEAGCRDADLLIIDSAMADKLTTKSLDVAAHVMRNANILVHDRSADQLRVLRMVGPAGGDRIQFR